MPGPDVIGIDASRLAVDRLTGTETYTLELIKALAALGSEQQFELYFNSQLPPDGLPSLGEPICIPFPRFWTHGRLSARMLLHRPSLLFVPAHVIPLIHPKSVVTIHDLGYLHHPETHPTSDLRMLDWSTRWSIRASKTIIAISQATRDDLIHHYRVNPDRIQVIHHGVSDTLRPTSIEQVARVRQRYTLPARYVLAVGTVQPRKNLGRLAKAIARLIAHGESIDLVIAGKAGWLSDQVEREIRESGAADRVHMLGYVDDRDLPALYSGAAVFCQPSLYEGFGMPLLEAMACGAPVVAANRSSLPEVSGDAARYFNPYDPETIADAISEVLNDSSLRTAMIELGRKRASSFTWRNTAEQTLDLLQRVERT